MKNNFLLFGTIVSIEGGSIDIKVETPAGEDIFTLEVDESIKTIMQRRTAKCGTICLASGSLRCANKKIHLVLENMSVIASTRD